MDVYLAPHVGDDGDIPEVLVSTKFSEHDEIVTSNTAYAKVGNAMHVDHTAELEAFLIS